ncbi:uncharacterized protein LOC133875111 [Alnus glutinosa]|uniref:uncharacterized protein LOC133875111 n=1 Tax=Alnus glutinosa TaxID=3517 RepID=UPI002D77849A|nr:uncharacterized protein LOC133875111 [Alnus glutinosa]
MGDFRPIACCNVIYKCITKILSKRMLPVLDFIVGRNQSAFIPGISISENILLVQELVKNYHRKEGDAKGLRQGNLLSPYLFVIAMEVFSKVMEDHTTNLSSIAVIKNALLEFEQISGLKANPSKSSLFCAGVSDGMRAHLLEDLQMNEGLLPLLSSVLFSLQVYWSSFFILPKKVLKDISQVFNRFLWNGGVEDNAKAKVAWKDDCFPKKEGGLGLKDLESWKTSAIMRHIWVMFARSGSLWVAWVQAYLLKGKSFWNVSTPQNGSWCWRKLLKFRHLARGLIRFEVGTGENIHLWMDNWHPFGALVEKFGFIIVYDFCSNLEAKLSSVLKDGIWCWRLARSEDLVEIQTKLSEVPLGIVDSPVWTISHSSVYVSADT